MNVLAVNKHSFSPSSPIWMTLISYSWVLYWIKPLILYWTEVVGHLSFFNDLEGKAFSLLPIQNDVGYSCFLYALYQDEESSFYF